MSKLHEKRCSESVEEARRILRKLGFEVVEDPKEPYDFEVIFVASGGTSRKIARLACGKRCIVWCSGKNNSLPSAFSALEKLRSKGCWLGELIVEKSPTDREELESRLRLLSALYSLKGGRVDVFATPNSPKILAEARFLKNLGLDIAFHHILSFDAYEPQENVVGVGVDCFEYIKARKRTPCLKVSELNDRGVPTACEADLSSLLIMMVVRKAYGEPAWIANLSRVERDKAFFAHCTAPKKMGERWEEVPHFETGLPQSLRVYLSGKAMAIHVNLCKRRSVVLSGRLNPPKLPEEGYCRTQAFFSYLDYYLEERFLEELLGNHFVIFFRTWPREEPWLFLLKWLGLSVKSARSMPASVADASYIFDEILRLDSDIQSLWEACEQPVEE